MHRIFVLLSSALLLYSVAECRHLYFHHLTTADGLASNSLNAVLRDSRGYIWVASIEGLQRYNGYSFRNWNYAKNDSNSLASNVVSSICEDDSGRIWAGTYNGVSCYDHRTGKMKRYTLDEPGAGVHVTNRIFCVAADSRNNIWATNTGGHVFRIDPQAQTVVRIRSGKPVAGGLSADATDKNDVCYDRETKELWIATGKGLNLYDPASGRFFNYRHNPRHLGVFNDRDTRIVFVDHRKRIWHYDAEAHTFYCWDRKLAAYTYKIDSLQGKPISNSFRFLFVDRSDRLWTGGWNREFYCIDLRKRNGSRNYSDTYLGDALSATVVQGMTEDHTGMLWFATDDGLFTYSDLLSQCETSPLTPVLEAGDVPASFYQDPQGGLYIGSAKGIFLEYDENTGTSKFLASVVRTDPVTRKEVANPIKCIFPRNADELWLGSNTGIRVFDIKKRSTKAFVPPDTSVDFLSNTPVWFMARDRNGNIWIATRKRGFVILDGQGRLIRRYNHTSRPGVYPLSTHMVNCFLFDSRGNSWVGLDGGNGISVLNRDLSRKTDFKWRSGTELGLTEGVIFSLCEDKSGRIWIGTHNSGVDVFDPATGKITNYRKDDGLPSDHVVRLHNGPDGNVWIITSNGICRFNPAVRKFEHFTLPPSMQTVSFGRGGDGAGSCMLPDGRLLIGRNGSFITLHPGRWQKNETPPPVVLEGISLRNIPLPDDRLSRPLEIHYDETPVTFEFAGLDYNDPGRNTYAYMLEGADKNWNYCGSTRTATYARLDGGKYVFRVKVANNDGVWNERGLALPLSVRPAFWNTWWFLLLCALTVAGAVFLLYKYRIRQLLKMHEMRSRIARDLHDDIGSGLSKISLLSELMIRNGDGRNERSEAEKISDTARELGQNVSEIVWALNTNNDSLENLAAYIRRYASEYLESSPLDLKIIAPPDIPDVTISGEHRRNMLFVVKEALHNIVKHAAAKNVELRFVPGNDQFTVVISDDGKGISAANRFGNGMKNMRQRMEAVNGSLTVESEAGTTITATLRI